MSDVVRLNIKSKNFKAVISKQDEENKEFSDYGEILEKEKLETAHKMELEAEFKKGYDKAKNEVENYLNEKHNEEILTQAEEFYRILKTFEEKIKSYDNSFHKVVIEVSQKIVEKILKREIENKSTISEILEQNLNKVIGANDIIIKLNPSEISIVEKTSKEKMDKIGISRIRFEASETIQKGGCLIETEVGNLDARIDSQLNEISKALETKLTYNVEYD
jgi:flagellar assembly protein FliH